MPIVESNASDENVDPRDSIAGKQIPAGVLVYRVAGTFQSSQSGELEALLKNFRQNPSVVILQMQFVLALDAAEIKTLQEIYEKIQSMGAQLLISGPHTQPLIAMQFAGFINLLGEENVSAHLDAALERARAIISIKASRD